MKIKTCELTGAALDLAVAIAVGRTDVRVDEDGELVGQHEFDYYTDWAQGGPIIEREKIDVDFCHFTGPWFACIGGKTHDVPERARAYGPTMLIAAMRCFVASKLGDEVEVPEELCAN